MDDQDVLSLHSSRLEMEHAAGQIYACLP